MRDIRNAKRAERAYFAREAMQRCSVCGRKFVLRAEKVCSRDCLAKLEASTRAKPPARRG
jgi:hypothetical protein